MENGKIMWPVIPRRLVDLAFSPPSFFRARQVLYAPMCGLVLVTKAGSGVGCPQTTLIAKMYGSILLSEVTSFAQVFADVLKRRCFKRNGVGPVRLSTSHFQSTPHKRLRPLWEELLETCKCTDPLSKRSCHVPEGKAVNRDNPIGTMYGFPP